MEENKQITRWANPDLFMEAMFRECPECHTISPLEHKFNCSKPEMINHHVKTTQFGPCSYLEWCKKLQAQLLSKGVIADIVNEPNGSRRIALCRR